MKPYQALRGERFSILAKEAPDVNSSKSPTHVPVKTRPAGVDKAGPIQEVRSAGERLRWLEQFWQDSVPLEAFSESQPRYNTKKEVPFAEHGRSSQRRRKIHSLLKTKSSLKRN